MKKIALIALLVFMGSVIPSVFVSGATGNEVHVAYFYANDCGNCKAVEPLIESLEENYSYLKTERYGGKEKYALYADVREK